MKLLLNNKEIAHFLNDNTILNTKTDHIRFEHTSLNKFILDHEEKMASSKVGKRSAKEYYTSNDKRKFANKLRKAVTQDLDAWKDEITDFLIRKKKYNFDKIHKNIDVIIDRVGVDYIFDLYRKSNYKNFVKGTGLTLDKNATFIRRKDFTSYEEDCLIRNTVGNENLLVNKIDKKYSMWFIDSGYTNFLEPNKKWHRLVRNHLHYGEFFDAPMSRLENFPKFPVPWRKDGDTIYVIEPGPFAASIFHCDLKTWKYDVEAELRKHTDKKIKFREKAPKRERTRLFDELLNEDYYCVVSINSNAATEAIWAGVPAITLGTHITNPVTRNKLSDINDLFYDNLGSWLAMLSYSQFTKEELMNGTARKIIGKYQGV